MTAKLLGLAAFGLADTNTVAGVVRAWQQAKVEGLAYHPGARLEFSDGTPDILAYPQDRRGWGHLCRMLTKANQRGEKGAPDLRLCDLVDWGESLSLAVMPTFGVLPANTTKLLAALRECFGRSLWLAVAPAHRGDDRFRLEEAQALAAFVDVPLMAVNEVLYHMPERRKLQDVLTAIRLKTTVAEAGLPSDRTRSAISSRRSKWPGCSGAIPTRSPRRCVLPRRLPSRWRTCATTIPTSRPNWGCRRKRSWNG